MPSEWYEAYGTVIWESFAFGKPVVASRIGGIPELVVDGLTGLTFNPGDFNELAEKIKYLNNNPLLIEKMGKYCRKIVEEKITLEMNYKEIIEIFEKLRNTF